jgi:N-acetylneuraminic acid mutarotase
MVFLAALATAGLIGMVNAADASLHGGAVSASGSLDTRSAQIKSDPLGISTINCADISRYKVDKQMNVRAAAILQKCGYGSGGSRSSDKGVAGQGSGTGKGNSGSPGVPPVVNQLTSPLLGGTDVDVILPDGTYPSTVQSEDMTWAHGSTVVTNYNDSRTAQSCYSGLAYSTDGGATFQHTGQPLCSGHGTNVGDPVVVYNAALSTWFAGDIAASGNCGAQGLGLWTSSDGITWSAGACAHIGSLDDRESMWVDNNPSSPYYGRMYMSWNNFTAGQVVQLTYSDNGTTWSAPVNLNNGSPFIRDIQLTGDPLGSGKVYVAGMNEGGAALGPRINHMYRSADGGVTWADSVMGAAFQSPGRTASTFAQMFTTMWRHQGWGQPAALGNNVYYDWAQCGQNVTCNLATDHGDIYFQRSTDGGVTWGTPTKLNTDTGTALQWQPSLAVTQAGALYAGWYDQREANGGADLNCTPGNTAQPCYRRWGRVSLDGGVTWQPDAQVGDVVTPLAAQPDTNIQSNYQGDYDYISAQGDVVYDHWTDGRMPLSGHAQQDVFLDRINVPMGTPTPTATGTPPTNTPTTTATPSVCGGGVWQAGPTMTPGRYTIQGALGSDGNVYVATGLDASSTPLPSQLARYNPTTNAWSNAAPPPVTVGEYSLASTGGKVYMAAGFLGGTSITSTLQIYDIASNSWSFGASMPASVEAAAGAILNGKFYVVGGDNFTVAERTTYIYDIASNTWTTGPQIPDTNGRTNTYGTSTGGKVYVWGGAYIQGSTTVPIDTMIAYDPNTNSWTALASANAGGLGNYGAVSPFGSGKLFITDGGDGSFTASNTTHIYDIASNTYTVGPPMLGARLGHAQATLADGRVFVYSGLVVGGGSPQVTETSELLTAIPCLTPTGTPTTAPTYTPTLTNVPTHTPTNTPTAGAPTSTDTPTTVTGPTNTATTVAAPTNTQTPVRPTPTACTIQFSDVPAGSTFYPYIHCLVCLGIVNGYPDGTFRPNADVTRGQLSKIVSNSAGFNDPQTTQMFQDVPLGSTFQVYIGRLASRGYINGYPCGGPGEPCRPGNLPYFRPNNNATRGQISKIDANAAGFSDPPMGQQFEDVAVGSTYYTYTYRLVSRSIMSGYPCGGAGEPCVPPANLPYFRPNNNATRGQTSKIVANTFYPDCQPPGDINK